VKLAGEHTFAVPRERLWRALTDPTLLARVLPGCEPLEATGDHSWRAAMTVAIGPVKGRFAGSLALFDLEPPSRYRMKIDGTGQAGFLSGEGAIELHEVEGGSRLAYQLDAQVGGRIASVGQRLVESSARVLAKQGLEGLERELAASVADEAAATPPAGEETAEEAAAPHAAAPGPPARRPPSTAAFAARFLWGLVGELPISWAYVALGMAAGVVLVLLLYLLLD
jgi:carbon monoxide dehydrogenase subunit G